MFLDRESQEHTRIWEFYPEQRKERGRKKGSGYASPKAMVGHPSPEVIFFTFS